MKISLLFAVFFSFTFTLAQSVFYRYENRIITLESDTTTIVIFHNEKMQIGGG